ncbi:hypothetical protein [Paractinoplanes rishiriensis]|uniref:DUF402 domain-containing protein n=1 Tax=Paractinoplanes rishiriensis TaxID=1050105 RepID=A0A919K060_9ACTN|nr:hypothetical protein [Actinoplanes rishiriensis]GIE98461.1 hypothetical protein Ari01nite_59260 [Actinoplanes rishiriensis]
MTDSIADQLTPTTVILNGKVRAAGRRLGQVIVYEWGFEHRGRDRVQRSFVLLDDGFQIGQPVVFSDELTGWWYCDLIKVVDHGDVVTVDDWWIDVIVGPQPDRPFRMLDLHEYAEAMERGALTTAQAADGLMRTQRFLDRRLNRNYDQDRGEWLAFPPPDVRKLMDVRFPREWSTITP